MNVNEYIYNMENPNLEDAVKKQYQLLYGKNDLVYNNPNLRDPIAANRMSYQAINQHDPRDFNPSNVQGIRDPYNNSGNDPRRTKLEGVEYYKGFNNNPRNVNYHNMVSKGSLTMDQFTSQLGNRDLKTDGATGLRGQVYTKDQPSELTDNMRIVHNDPNRFTTSHGQTKYLALTPLEKRFREMNVGTVYADPNEPHGRHDMKQSAIDIYTTKTYDGHGGHGHANNKAHNSYVGGMSNVGSNVNSGMRNTVL